MDHLTKLVDRLDENGRISHVVTDGGITKISAPWLFIVSTALSFEDEEEFSRDQLPYHQIFGCAEFGLTPEITDYLRHAMERVLNHMKPELTQIDILWKQLDGIKWSWLNCPNDFARHMNYITVLAREVMSAFNWYEWQLGLDNFIEYDQEQYRLLQRFESEVIKPLKDNLTSAAYDILNVSKYGKEGMKTIAASDITILYFVFDIFAHSITVARSDPEKFAMALMYRTNFDDYMYDCLFKRNDLHQRITILIDHGRFAIDDMLDNLGASVLARILLMVYPGVDANGYTFLHTLIHRHCNHAFIELFPHCEQLWFITQCFDQTPMGLLFHLNQQYGDLNVLYQCVCHNADFFASLV